MGAELSGELKLNRCYLVEENMIPANFTYHQLYLKLDEVGGKTIDFMPPPS